MYVKPGYDSNLSTEPTFKGHKHYYSHCLFHGIRFKVKDKQNGLS